MTEIVGGIDALLEQLRPQLLARVGEAERLVQRIKAAADEYLEAVESDLAADVRTRMGLGPPTGLRGPSAAARLLAEIESLPGLADAHRTYVAVSGAEGVHEAGEVHAPPTEHDLRALFTEFQSADFETVTNDVFRAMAEEYVCRARYCQDANVPDPSDMVGRIIRKLTALSSMRGLRDVFGMKRAHQADWAARAKKARETRERLLAPPEPTASDDEG